MHAPAFGLDSLSDFAAITRLDDVLMPLDMVQGYYYHVALHPDSRSFAGFAWRGRYYVFNVLPYGIATAPRCFAIVMGMLVHCWRGSRIRMIAYLDDWLFQFSRAEARHLVQRILADSRRARIAINVDKS